MTVPELPSLTPEERDLAQRIARLAPLGGPSPEVDTRILASARAAASQPSHRRRDWRLAAGLAASLVLAVGIAWRLRPLPEPPANAQPAAAMAIRVISSPPRARAAEVVQEASPERTPRDIAEPAVVAARPAPAATPTTPRPEPAEAPPPPIPSAEPAVVLDESAAAKAATQPTPPAPTPPAPSPVAEPQAFGSALPAPVTAAPHDQAANNRRAAATIQAQSGAAAARPATAAEAATVVGEDEPEVEVPPATVDSPAVRDAWLKRIHDLVDRGDIEGARSSLHEFVRRYPTFALPEDLRALEK